MANEPGTVELGTIFVESIFTRFIPYEEGLRKLENWGVIIKGVSSSLIKGQMVLQVMLPQDITKESERTSTEVNGFYTQVNRFKRDGEILFSEEVAVLNGHAAMRTVFFLPDS